MRTEQTIPASEVIAAIEAWKSLWWKVPSFGNKVNKATREAITAAHGPLFVLLDKARRAPSTPQPSDPTTPNP